MAPARHIIIEKNGISRLPGFRAFQKPEALAISPFSFVGFALFSPDSSNEVQAFTMISN